MFQVEKVAQLKVTLLYILLNVKFKDKMLCLTFYSGLKLLK